MNSSLVKYFSFFVIIIINYFLISMIVLIFSLVSLKNNKVYDFLWVKYVQMELYYEGGLRNIFQYSTSNCVQFDEDLLYVPKEGECEFANPEFNTKLNFDKERRLNLIDDKITKEENVIGVLGDSIAMGWGVENNQTFSYNLEKLQEKKVINYGVSSYGTIREIKRLKASKYYNQIDTIIIQYHLNDLGENLYIDPKKKYEKKNFDDFNFKYNFKINSANFLLRVYKKTLRLLVSHLSDLIFTENNIENKEFYRDLDTLEKIISESFYNENKRIIVFAISHPWEHFVYDRKKKYNSFEFFEIKLENKHKFIIDDHPNVDGHEFISEKIYDYLKKNSN